MTILAAPPPAACSAPASSPWLPNLPWQGRRRLRTRGLALRPQQPDWKQLIEMCRLVDAVLVDQDSVLVGKTRSAARFSPSGQGVHYEEVGCGTDN
jgi:hypothetical protein